MRKPGGWPTRSSRPASGPSRPSRSMRIFRNCAPGGTTTAPGWPGITNRPAPCWPKPPRWSRSDAPPSVSRVPSGPRCRPGSRPSGKACTRCVPARTPQGALLNDAEKYPGVLGGVAALVSVDTGAQEAIAAALGGAADAVAVTGLDAAVAILEILKDEDAGSAGLMIASGSPGNPAPPADGGLPPGVQLPGMGPSPPSRWYGHRTGWRRPWPGCCPASSWPPTWPRPGNWSAPTRRCG